VKIVHIANFYGPNSGGIKTTLHELGRGYLQHGHDFIYIVPGTTLASEETPYGRKISLPSFLLPGSGGYRVILNNRALKRLLDELKPDRIEISDRFTLISLGKWARSRKIPTVVFSHETLRGLAERFLPLPAILRNQIVDWHNKRLARSFGQVIATTDFAAKEFHDISISNLEKVPLGVDLQTFHPNNFNSLYREELLKGSEVLLVHVGRLSPEKEPQRSVEALIELRRRGIDARLVIVGTGPMWKKIRELSQGHPVDTLGYICDRHRVAAILASADISLAPGPLETFCLSALESLASGTPVVASASSAVGEFLKLGAPVPAGAIAEDDFFSFADAIQDLLEARGASEVARDVAEDMPWEKSIARMRAIHKIDAIGERAPHTSTRRRVRSA
jgi:alpha-1,6-mannosyltransferase